MAFPHFLNTMLSVLQAGWQPHFHHLELRSALAVADMVPKAFMSVKGFIASAPENEKEFLYVVTCVHWEFET